MEYKLELTLVFSSDLDETLFTYILKEIKNLAKTEFLRGIYKANRLFLNFESDRELSGLVFKLVKRIKEVGRVYKLGVRDFYVPYYELCFTCDFTGKVKIPIGTCICNGENCRLVFMDLEKNFLRGGVNRTINLINSKIAKKEFVLVSEKKKETDFDGDPIEEMKKNNLIKKGLIKEENFYLPAGAKLIKILKNKILIEFKNKFKIEEIFIPQYIPLDLLNNENILKFIPPEIFSNIVAKPKDKNKIYESYYLLGKVPKMETKNIGVLFNELPLILYRAFENKKIDKEMFLYYLSNLKLVIIFFDNKKKYEFLKKEVLEFLKQMIDTFDLRYRVLIKKLNGELFKFQFYLPYKKSWLSVIDIYFSNENYTRPFRIEGKSGEIVIYLENFLISEIAQKGYLQDSKKTEEKL